MTTTTPYGCRLCGGAYFPSDMTYHHAKNCPAGSEAVERQINGQPLVDPVIVDYDARVSINAAMQRYEAAYGKPDDETAENILQLTDSMTLAEPRPIWFCKIGTLDNSVKLPPAADAPMRALVELGYRLLTGRRDEFCFSGWSAELTESELAVVMEDRNRKDDGMGVVEANFSLYVDGWTMGSTNTIGEILCTAPDGRTVTVPSKALTAFLARRLDD